MRFLFIIQGEGRGHFTQALSMAAILRKHGHKVVAALVGKSKARTIPAFFTEKIGASVFDFDSPNFTSFYKNKKPSIVLSSIENFAHTGYYLKSMQFVKAKIEAYNPDTVVNFYDLIAGLTFSFYKLDEKLSIEFVCVGHQYILLNPNYKTSPEQDVKFYFLRGLTKWTCQRASKLLALSFRYLPDYEERSVFTVPPLLRRDVFDITPRRGNYIHGYMLNPGYYAEIKKWHKKNPTIPLRFFWDKKEAEEVTEVDKNLILHQLNDQKFLESMASSMAYSTTSGFESICEAMYFKKPVLMIPVHVEQEFNAYDASLSGAGISSKKFNLDKLIRFIPKYLPDPTFNAWVDTAEERIISVLCEKKSRKRIGVDIFLSPK